ncbi:DUF11 domain-containing protein [Rathayibacter sp. VKM Ac-2630]|uniref:DUF11 domain-containing protein n=1 Tax=Rathayibacter sp. VKM Ac-2630 TaxID=1938617 RepID=UPI000981955B|nr:DUF11 domain-containing protein [Rathayibacter sp. VKM Ac-2630]OOB89444.1 hypothetical protein B0T42_17405 [Rathayibacter sp. VKM Ac-2630]
MSVHDPAAPVLARRRPGAPRILAAVLGALLVGSAGLAPLSPASAAPTTIVVGDTGCQEVAGNIGAQGPAEITPRAGGGSTCFVPSGFGPLGDDVVVEIPAGWTLSLAGLSSDATIRTSDSCGAAGEADACALVLDRITNRGTIEIGSSASSVVTEGSVTNEGSIVLGEAADGAAAPTFTNAGRLTNVGSLVIDDEAVFTNQLDVNLKCGSTLTGVVAGIAPFDACTPPTLSGDAPAGQVAVAYSYVYSVAGDSRAAANLRVAEGALPPGLYLNFRGDLYGYPSQAGTFTFELTTQNDLGGSRLTDTIEISAVAPTITGTAAAGMVGEDYYSEYVVTGAPAPVLTLASGTLPPGVELTPFGLYGRPTTAGTFTFTIAATNSAGSARITSTVTIAPRTAVATTADLRVDLSAPSSATKGRTFAYAVRTANAGPATATSVVTKVVLPQGVQFVSASGNHKRYGPIVVFTTPSLANGRTATQTITVKSTTTGQKTGAAAVLSTKTPDQDIRNNTDTTATSIR